MDKYAGEPIVMRLRQRMPVSRLRFRSVEQIHEFALRYGSQVPEVIILAILGDYEKEQVEPVLRLILRGLKAASRSEAELRKYVQQLLLLSKLRKLSEITDKIIREMLITYDYTEDIYYKRGIEAAQKQIEQAERKIAQEREKVKQEREKAERQVAKEREKARQEKIESIRALLAVGNFDNVQIAGIMNVTEEFVEQIAKSETE